MKIEQRNPQDLKPYPDNPRINDAAVDAGARSIKDFGFRPRRFGQQIPCIVQKRRPIIHTE